MTLARQGREHTRLWQRVSLLCAHLGLAVVLSIWLRLRHGGRWYRHPRGERIRTWWMRRLCRVLGMRVHYDGMPLAEPGLLVANHVSWLDIVAISSAVPSFFVAKDDVQRWPLIGHLAAASGTLFLRRTDVSGLSTTIATLVEVLEAGHRVVVFPEGTTTAGNVVGNFHRALFQAPIMAHRPVQAIAVRYMRAGQLDTLAPFIGDDSFVPHLLRILRAPRTDVYLNFCAKIAPGGKRRVLSEQALERIRTCLQPWLAEAALPDVTARASDAAPHRQRFCIARA